MMLSHNAFDSPILFEENKINVLVIENHNFLTKCIVDLKTQINDSIEGEFILSDNNDAIGFKNTDIVTDIFSFEINNRKNLTKLYSYLSELSYNETNYSHTLSVVSAIRNYVTEISDNSDYTLSVSEFNVQDLFKICDLKFAVDNSSIPEKLCDYISVLSEFLKVRLFVFLNLRQFVSEDDIAEIYKYITYNKINVLLIEGFCPEIRLTYEKYKIIDKDLCEIY